MDGPDCVIASSIRYEIDGIPRLEQVGIDVEARDRYRVVSGLHRDGIILNLKHLPADRFSV